MATQNKPFTNYQIKRIFQSIYIIHVTNNVATDVGILIESIE